MTKHGSHITIVIHNALLEDVVEYLQNVGINHLYSLFGRSLLLNESKGFRSLFFNSDLITESVDLLSFYIPEALEERLMKSVVKKFRLDIPGRGSIFSRRVTIHSGHINELLCDIKKDMLIEESEMPEVTVYDNLTQILCTMSKGLADELGKVLLHLGVVPAITYATGTGLRDQLGLLRITIPKEKEFLSIVVGPHEASNIMAKMINWAKLDRPGRGFIWQVPVRKGLINFKTSQKAIGQAASAEQIIAAIDSLKGDFTWRQGGGVLTDIKKRNYYSGTQLVIQVNEGLALPIVRQVMRLGISGATVQSLRSLSPALADEHIVVPQEVIRLVVTNDLAQSVIDCVIKMTNQAENATAQPFIFTMPVIRAFNYLAPHRANH